MALTTTTTTRACVYKSVTLVAGEKFSLPPNSTLLGASGGTSALTSTCPIPTLQPLQCYFAVFQGTDEIGGSLPAYNDVRVDGIMINTIKYPFVGGGFQFNSNQSANTFTTQLNTKIQTTSVGSAILNLKVTDFKIFPGEYYRFTFDTVPNIGDTMEFYAYGGSGRQGGPGTDMSFLVKKCTTTNTTTNSAG